METETPGAIIGRRLRELREAGFYTRHELAERSGLSEQGIAHLERGRAKRPRRETLEKAAKGLGVPIGALLRETGGEATEAATPTTEDVYAQMDRLYERHAAGEIDTETLLQRTADVLVSYTPTANAEVRARAAEAAAAERVSKEAS